RGVFIGNLDAEERRSLDAYKYTFRHKQIPIWNGIGSVPFGSTVGVGRYLFPAHDPVEAMVTAAREGSSTMEHL
ncbi:MAG: hypothetical protein ACRDQ2_01505, partial [Gaiellales bacterium]